MLAFCHKPWSSWLPIAVWRWLSDSAVSMACRRSPAGDPPTGPRHRWKPRCRTSRAGTWVPWRRRPGGRGSGVPWCWRPGVGGRGFHGIGDLGVSSLSHTALWPPHGDSVTDWITTPVTLLTALCVGCCLDMQRRDGLSPSTWRLLSAVGQPSAVPCDTGER